MDAEQYDKAIPSLKLAIKADQWYIEPHYNLAVCYIKKGIFDNAIPELEEVIRINTILKKGHHGVMSAPRYEMQAHSNLGNIYNIKGQTDKAISHYKEALKISPKDTSTRFNLAVTYEGVSMIKEAWTEFEEVIKIDPLDQGARTALNRLGGR